ncbi:MAG TPA: energy transducer TonB [Puia sp.]|jgi:protein TonB|nr:energy transducer TonB [Puia sp.]
MKVIFLLALYLFATEVKGQDTLKKLKETMDSATLYKVEIESQFPGGDEAWRDFLANNMRYPKEAIKKNIEGVVTVRFIVDKDGTVTNIEAESGPDDGGLKAEAIRVIRRSGKWKPALQYGRYVKSYKRQAMVFRLQ